MEIKIGTKQILKVLYVLSCLIFVGLCIDACGFIFNSIYSYFRPIGAQYYWNHLDFSALYAFDKLRFLTTTFLTIIVLVLKAILFYLIVKLFYDKKVNLEHPFQLPMQQFISLSAYLAFGIGLFSSWATNNYYWLVSQKIALPPILELKIEGSGIWFFMSIFLFIIAQIFKRGIEMQNENDLTV
ncbi:DUF2975 domain-containing protein [Flavobacterium sp.]|uniref:DUF2975 domain-containing protein n=1 Tax=Flavobacterium sp. TaxID=239 RepID=UPI0025BE0E55|nr:DUF2975 domain-containing protein [Flavobacterium sp.]